MDSIPSVPGALPPPPPISVPPIITPPPRKGRGWIILSLVLLAVLAISLFGNLSQFVSGALSFDGGFHQSGIGVMRDASPKMDEFIIENNGSKDKVAVITVSGVIAGAENNRPGMVDVFKAQLERAREDRHVKAVILRVDSPGGEVLASDEMYNALCAFQSDEADEQGRVGRPGKPVICSMGSLAASGGYYIASASRWIIANRLTITGSIGVIMHGYNYRGLMDKVGVAPVTFKSGRFKDMLSGDRRPDEIPSEERVMVQGLIDETYGIFKHVVADGRGAAQALNKTDGRALVDNWEEFADGRVISGMQAYNLGFVDELGDFDTAVGRTLDIAGLQSANLVEYRERYDLSSLFSIFGQSARVQAIKLDLGVESPRLRPGLMYYLYLP